MYNYLNENMHLTKEFEFLFCYVKWLMLYLLHSFRTFMACSGNFFISSLKGVIGSPFSLNKQFYICSGKLIKIYCLKKGL